MGRMEEYVQLMKTAGVGVDDTFRFRCTKCGKCCRYKDDVIMTPFDMYNAAKRLGITTGEIAPRCTFFMGQTSFMPLITADMREEDGVCTFMGDNGCVLGSMKPGCCSLYPLGRAAELSSGKITYFMQPVDCGAKDEEHTPREWLGEGFADGEEFFLKWNTAIGRISERMRQIFNGGTFGAAIASKAAEMLAEPLYLDYSTDEEFTPQFEKNVQTCMDFLDFIEKDLKESHPDIWILAHRD